MRRERGMSLLELLAAMSLMSIGLAVGFSLLGAERLTSREHQEAFRRSATASRVLHELGEDLREAVRVVPRHEGPGALVFLSDGSVAAWFARSGREGEIHRKVLHADGAVSPDRVVARGIADLTVEAVGRLVTARVSLGDRGRTLTVRRRHAP